MKILMYKDPMDQFYPWYEDFANKWLTATMGTTYGDFLKSHNIKAWNETHLEFETEEDRMEFVLKWT